MKNRKVLRMMALALAAALLSGCGAGVPGETELSGQESLGGKTEDPSGQESLGGKAEDPAGQESPGGMTEEQSGQEDSGGETREASGQGQEPSVATVSYEPREGEGSSQPDPCPEDVDPPAVFDEEAAGEQNLLAKFSFDLFGAVDEENPVLSPLSAYLALSMVGAGAKGETAREFTDLMGEDMTAQAADLMERLPRQEEHIRLELANSVWMDQVFQADPQWQAQMEEEMHAQVRTGELAGRDMMEQINGWVSEKTQGLIPQLLGEPLKDGTRMALFNTVYFKGEWENPFEAMDTMEEPFYPAQGGEVSAEIMRKWGETLSYVKGEDLDGVVLPYRDCPLAFVALKPTGGQSVREMYGELDSQALSRLLDERTDTLMNLKLPKFEIEFSRTLNEDLQGLGLQLAFDPYRADLTGLGYTDAGIPLCIDLVAQKALIRVDEEGTEAAAVTEIAMMECALAVPLRDPVDVFFTEPFVYMILDTQTQTPLFMGIYDRPVQ